MILIVHQLPLVLLVATLGATLASILYLALATCVVAWHQAHRRRNIPTPSGSGNLQPVTILKPICGPDPDLYGNLRSFCQQAYPQYQCVFGVSDSEDPAIAIVQRVIADFPHLDLALVVD